MIIFISGALYTFKDLKADYTPWLGPKWREELLAREKPIPTVVMNHLGWLDNVFSIRYFNTTYVPRGDVEKIPIFGRAVASLGAVFAHRAASQDQRDKAVRALFSLLHRLKRFLTTSTKLNLVRDRDNSWSMLREALLMAHIS